MSRTLIVRPEAERDMAEAFDWYENRVSGLGVEFLDRIDVIFQAIARNPRQFRVVYRNVRRALTRHFPYGVFYLENDTSITVLAVFHSRRDPTRWQERI